MNLSKWNFLKAEPLHRPSVFAVLLMLYKRLRCALCTQKALVKHQVLISPQEHDAVTLFESSISTSCCISKPTPHFDNRSFPLLDTMASSGRNSLRTCVFELQDQRRTTTLLIRIYIAACIIACGTTCSQSLKSIRTTLVLLSSSLWVLYPRRMGWQSSEVLLVSQTSIHTST